MMTFQLGEQVSGPGHMLGICSPRLGEVSWPRFLAQGTEIELCGAAFWRKNIILAIGHM